MELNNFLFYEYGKSELFEFIGTSIKSDDNILIYGNLKEIKKYLLTVFLVKALQTDIPIFLSVDDLEFESGFYALHKMIRPQTNKRFVIQDAITNEKKNYSYIVADSILRFDKSVNSINIIDINSIVDENQLSMLLNTNSLNVIISSKQKTDNIFHEYNDFFDKIIHVSLSNNDIYTEIDTVTTSDINKKYTYDSIKKYYEKIISIEIENHEFNFDKVLTLKKRYNTMRKNKSTEHLLLETEINFNTIEKSMKNGVDFNFIRFIPFATNIYKK